MANASVEKEAVKRSIALCERSIQQYKDMLNRLKTSYVSAGTEWRDAKYRELGELLNECTGAFRLPLKELEESKAKLGELLKAMEEYENIDL